MNPDTGNIHYGSAEVLDRIGKKVGAELVPIPEEELPTVEAMNTSQRKAWAKRQRKGASRLKEWGIAKRAESSATAFRKDDQ